MCNRLRGRNIQRVVCSVHLQRQKQSQRQEDSFCLGFLVEVTLAIVIAYDLLVPRGEIEPDVTIRGDSNRP